MSSSGRYLRVNNVKIPIKQLTANREAFDRTMSTICKDKIYEIMEYNMSAVFLIDWLVFQLLIKKPGNQDTDIYLKPFCFKIGRVKYKLPTMTGQYNKRLEKKLLAKID